ncbi:MAG: hypothetical protein KAR31_03160, partial [Candidatus Omnitrophica bacterium]|nr:hypothetical protein [Candidatus Omnitrophota bacterium]
MNNRAFIIFGFIIFFSLTVPVTGQAGANPELLEVAQDKLKEKTLHSGTLDIFDNDRGQVRNLRLIKMHDTVVEKEGGYLIATDYRDINTGDIVEVEIELVSSEEDFIIGNIRIKDVKAIDDGS